MNKKIALSTIIFLLLIPVLMSCNSTGNDPSVSETPATPMSTAEPSPIPIVIDPGHGRYDPGKVGVTGVLEKDVNLAIANCLSGFLSDYKDGFRFKVTMTRTSDSDITATTKKADLDNRLKIISEASPFMAISIHGNSYTSPEIKGSQVFYYSEDEASINIATHIKDALLAHQDPDNHREIKANSSYYLLKNSTFPIVIVECGFLSNPEEETLLNTPEYQKKTAFAIFSGIVNYIKSN